MVSIALLIASLVCSVVGKPVTRNLQVHEARTVPPQFQHSGPASPDTVLNLRLALVQSDPVGLQNTLLEVSDPSSASYGQWLSKEKVENFVSPSAESVEAVTMWLQENSLNASKLSPAGDWLSISVPVSKANELLNADFSVFEHVDTGAQAIRTLQYSIPMGFESHIDLIHPTVQFPIKMAGPQLVSAQPSNTDATPASSCASAITPQCLLDLYGIPSTPAKDKSNVLGVSSFEDDWANTADLQQFLKTFRPDLPSSQTFTLLSIDGGNNDQSRISAGLEANLDTQYTMGIASLVPTTFISVGFDTTDGIGGFLDEILYLINASAPPQVLTTSYGFNEDSITEALAINMCNAYAQLGTRGVSVVFASGDGGVSGGHTGDCSAFVPVFPASCPFVTSVGGTTSVPETAADFSSGGFSNIFAVPSWQADAVNDYMTVLGDTYTGLYNRSGRGFPDVSAQSYNFSVVQDATILGVQGTSCASPTFASVISLLNDGLLSAGKPVLGFLNPLLYANPDVLADITTGSNPGCGTDGFNATTGWDPITGLGTPQFAAFQKLVDYSAKDAQTG
ncbi:family S53 protease-like protein [Obba rivulosa]|uniref:tripeptidyl-peptidase II n=1 Tax=Obba rivulosa TaxID=1052685 RepID=A0A8E2DFS1_9APHY|nr:family S53 protease-like protein [Obba rivulosa]